MTRTNLIQIATALLLTSGFATGAIAKPKPAMAQKNNKAVSEAQKQKASLIEEVDQSALEGFNKVRQAMLLLTKDGKEKQAIKYLQEATGKLDVALSANPKLALVPIDSSVAIHELAPTPAAVKLATKNAIRLLKKKEVQAARALLAPLKDEMVIETAYLPMATYPDAIKLATKYVIDGKREEAVQLLASTMSTITVSAAIIPLPLVRVESLLAEASTLDKDKEKANALELVKEAEGQLKLAVLLGYTSEHAAQYRTLNKQVRGLKREIRGKNAVEKLYENLKESVHKLLKDESKPAKSTAK